MKKRFAEAQVVRCLRETDVGLPVKDLCRKHGFSEASYYLWRSKFGGMSVSDAKRLKKLLAESLLENEVTREVLRKLYGPPPPCKEIRLMGASAPMYAACMWRPRGRLAMMGSRASLAF